MEDTFDISAYTDNELYEILGFPPNFVPNDENLSLVIDAKMKSCKNNYDAFILQQINDHFFENDVDDCNTLDGREITILDSGYVVEKPPYIDLRPYSSHQIGLTLNDERDEVIGTNRDNIATYTISNDLLPSFNRQDYLNFVKYGFVYDEEENDEEESDEDNDLEEFTDDDDDDNNDAENNVGNVEQFEPVILKQFYEGFQLNKNSKWIEGLENIGNNDNSSNNNGNGNDNGNDNGDGNDDGDRGNVVQENTNNSSQIVGYTKEIQYTSSRLNPNYKEIITRVITVDSNRRLNPNDKSTNFTVNLSSPLKNVLSLKLYSFNIPNTWYVVNNNFGSNFFYFKGTTAGLENKTYQISIPSGSYNNDPTQVITAIQSSIDTSANIYTDISLVGTTISYLTAQSKAQIIANITDQYNEQSYSLTFNHINGGNTDGSPVDIQTNSLAGFLGFQYQNYNFNSIYSTRNLSPTYNPRIVVDSSNNYFYICKYGEGDGGTGENIVIGEANNTIHILSTYRIDVPSTQSPISLLQYMTLVNSALSSSIYCLNGSVCSFNEVNETYIANYGSYYFELLILLNRLETQNYRDERTCILFPIGNSNIWTSTSNTGFRFQTFEDPITYLNNQYYVCRLGDIIAELETVDSNYPVIGTTYLYLQTLLPSFSTDDVINFAGLSNGITQIKNNFVVKIATDQDGYTMNRLLNLMNGYSGTSSLSYVADLVAVDDGTNNSKFQFSNITFLNGSTTINDENDFLLMLNDDNGNPTFVSFLLQSSGVNVSTMVNVPFNDVLQIITNIPNSSLISFYDLGFEGNYFCRIISADSNNKCSIDISIPFYDQNGGVINNLSNLAYNRVGWATVFNRCFFYYMLQELYGIDGNENQKPLLNSFLTMTPVLDGLLGSYNLLFEINLLIEFVLYPYHYEVVLVDGGGQLWQNIGFTLQNYDLSLLQYNTMDDLGNYISTSFFSDDLIASSVDTVWNPTVKNDGFQLQGSVDGVLPDVYSFVIQGSNLVNLSRFDLLQKINQYFTSATNLNQSFAFVRTVGLKQYVVLRCKIKKKYTTKDYRLVFYDKTSFVKCDTSAQLIQNATFNSTLGYILGFKAEVEYFLDEEYYTIGNGINELGLVSVVSGSNGSTILISDSTINFATIYTNFYILLEDYSQNVLNDSLITASNVEQNASINQSDYAKRCIQDVDGNQYLGLNVQSYYGQAKGISLKHYYSQYEKRKSMLNVQNSEKNITYYEKGVFCQISPNKLSDNGGSLSNQFRTYFGPITLQRLKLQIFTDKGNLLDLNGSDWSISFVCDQMNELIGGTRK